MEVGSGRVSGVSARVQGRAGFACPAPAREHRFPQQRAVRRSGQACDNDGVEPGHGGTAWALSRRVLGRKRAEELHQGVRRGRGRRDGVRDTEQRVGRDRLEHRRYGRDAIGAGEGIRRARRSGRHLDADVAPHLPGALPRHHDDIHREVRRAGSRLRAGEPERIGQQDRGRLRLLRDRGRTVAADERGLLGTAGDRSAHARRPAPCRPRSSRRHRCRSPMRPGARPSGMPAAMGTRHCCSAPEMPANARWHRPGSGPTSRRRAPARP